MLSDVIELPLSHRERFGGMLGRSVAMRRLFAVLERIVLTDATVLVEGETGTGKELVAEAVHEESPRHGDAPPPSRGPGMRVEQTAAPGDGPSRHP